MAASCRGMDFLVVVQPSEYKNKQMSETTNNPSVVLFFVFCFDICILQLQLFSKSTLG